MLKKQVAVAGVLRKQEGDYRTGAGMRPVPPTVLLYCFSHAGSSALAFRDWQGAFPENIRIRPVELPGRGKRMGAPLLRDYRTLVMTLAREIADDLASVRRQQGNVLYAGFGHGTGAVFNFGVCARLSQRLGQAPAHCFLSAGLPLHIERKKRSALSDQVLVDEIRAFSGAPKEVLDQLETANSFLPVYRADCAANEESVLDRSRMLDCPLTLFAADKDAVLMPETIWEWETYTSRAAHKVLLQGDHFSVLHSPQEMIAHIRSAIDPSKLQQPFSYPHGGSVLRDQESRGWRSSHSFGRPFASI